MTPVERVLARLPDVRKSGNGWSARCPAHEDRHASLSVAQGDDGRALVKCHAGCPTVAVCAAVGLTLRSLMPDGSGLALSRNGKPRGGGQTFATASEAVQFLEAGLGRQSVAWTYHDASEVPVGLTLRWDKQDGKVIRPVSRHGHGWRVAAMPTPRPLYGLPALRDASRVIVPEGEKAADAARALGFTATTSAGGARAAGMTDWSPLAGKDVWLLPDNDAAGRKYADAVVDALTTLSPPAVVRVIELPGLPAAGDIVDWIDTHGEAAEPAAMRAEIEALALAAEPVQFEQPNGPDHFRPFPVEALPEPIRGFVSAGSKAIGCDPSYLALPLLVALAAAIGNTRRLELKRGWLVPPILWGAIVGESGTAKSPALALVLKPVQDRERKALERHAEEMRKYDAELDRWEKEKAKWKHDKKAIGDPPAKPMEPRAERYVVVDTTVEALAPILRDNPRGVLLARDELAGWLGSFDRYSGNKKTRTDVANWLPLFNAGSITVDRKTGSPRTIHVPSAAVCVIGGIQPGILRKALDLEHREAGLAARLLLAAPPRKPKKWNEADIDPRAEAELARLFDRLYSLQPSQGDEGESRPVLVTLTAEAKSIWVSYYSAHANEQVDLTGDLSAAWSKLEEYAARLALVIHFVRWAAGDPTLAGPDRLDAESIGAGIELTKWFKNEARRVYAMLDETAKDGDDRRLIEWIERKGGTVSVREAQQGCRWLKAPGAAEAALTALVAASRGRWNTTGRPANRVFVLTSPASVYKTPAIGPETGGCVDVDSVDDTETQADAGAAGDRLFPELPGPPH